ncbi:MAG: DNA gyrase modulator, partial [Candidatus Bathyarchaeia archaeon]
MNSSSVDTLMKLSVKKHPDQVEAYWSRNRIVTTRIASNNIVEAKAITIEGASVRLILKKSIGFASTTDLTGEGLEEIIEEAYSAAKSKGADADFTSLPEPSKPSETVKPDDRLLELDSNSMVQMG